MSLSAIAKTQGRVEGSGAFFQLWGHKKGDNTIATNEQIATDLPPKK